MTNNSDVVTTTETDSSGNVKTTSTPFTPSPLEAYGGRKFMLSLFIFIMTWIALFLGLISKEVFQYITYTLIFIYVGGNVTQKIGLNIADIFGNKNNTPSN